MRKCKGSGCPSKKTCMRFTSPACPNQNWMIEKYSPSAGCDNYWKDQPDFVNAPEKRANCEGCGEVFHEKDLRSSMGSGPRCPECLRRWNMSIAESMERKPY